MASYTTNLNLKKPSGSEAVAIGDINGNMDTIDTAYGSLNGKLEWKLAGTNTGTSAVSLSNWNEILILVGIASDNKWMPMFIHRQFILDSTGTQKFNFGRTAGSDGDVEINVTSSSVSLALYYIGTTDKTANATIKVYYR